MSDIPRASAVGRRVVVTGLARGGEEYVFANVFGEDKPSPHCSRLPLLAARLVEPTEAEWREKQKRLLAGDDWIADGNYHATLDLRLERADTVVFLDIRWWICAWRALVRGVRTRPGGFELPTGCDESRWRRLRE